MRLSALLVLPQMQGALLGTRQILLRAGPGGALLLRGQPARPQRAEPLEAGVALRPRLPRRSPGQVRRRHGRRRQQGQRLPGVGARARDASTSTIHSPPFKKSTKATINIVITYS